MTARHHRLARAAEVAADDEQRARGVWLELSRRLGKIDREREIVLERAARLAEQDLSAPLRAQLVETGSRHLMSLAEDKAALAPEVAKARRMLDTAMIRTRSLERVVLRLVEAEEEHQRRMAEADWRDLVVTRAAARARVEEDAS